MVSRLGSVFLSRARLRPVVLSPEACGNVSPRNLIRRGLCQHRLRWIWPLALVSAIRHGRPWRRGQENFLLADGASQVRAKPKIELGAGLPSRRCASVVFVSLLRGTIASAKLNSRRAGPYK